MTKHGVRKSIFGECLHWPISTLHETRRFISKQINSIFDTVYSFIREKCIHFHTGMAWPLDTECNCYSRRANNEYFSSLEVMRGLTSRPYKLACYEIHHRTSDLAASWKNGNESLGSMEGRGFLNSLGMLSLSVSAPCFCSRDTLSFLHRLTSNNVLKSDL